jgi:hypothetical protein
MESHLLAGYDVLRQASHVVDLLQWRLVGYAHKYSVKKIFPWTVGGY